ncbi:MAG: class I adenylate cyclase [Desulfamplus sp.]|nr:class I adenylate cyclase [Desulfamplus sp.]
MGRFERDWSRADANQQVEWLNNALEMPLADGVKAVMAGLTSFHTSVKNKAKYVLGKLQENIKAGLASDHKSRGLLDSALLSVNVYKNIHKNLSAAELKLYLQILLESGGRGPFYAWKLCQSKMFSMQTIIATVNLLTEPCRLTLVNQYLASPPSVRREYADQFVKILRDITDQITVLRFYADMFDKENPADIFLENIKPSLRNCCNPKEPDDPNTLIGKYLNSDEQSDSYRIYALKAVALLSPVINPSKLLRIIKSDRSPEMKRTAFKVIERSSVGTYAVLTDSIMDIICSPSEFSKTSLIELMEMFKAAVISAQANLSYSSDRANFEKKSGLADLILRIRREIPALLPLILNEIASFSRFSFCFIQDMAEDPSASLFRNSDIEHALICGVIRKRPERMITIFETYMNHPDPVIKDALSRLVEKLKKTLAEKKNDLKREFEQFVASGKFITKKKEKEKGKGGFFKNLFTVTLEKKISLLKESSSPDGVDFKDEVIEDVDLSSYNFISPGIFTGSIIRDVDLSLSSFANCSFNKTFFYNVKMNGTLFVNTSFEQSVFIDVKADGTKFSGCNFTGASFLNSSFKSSDMTEAVLADCTIVKTYFEETELSGATFVNSRISMVTFAESRLEQTDFSGVTGKFCRFSAHTLSRAETEQADLYSRIIEISYSDIHRDLTSISQDKLLMNEIRMLIFTELIQHGKNMFLLKNQYAILYAFDLFQPEQADLFELIPLLIHENIDIYTPSSRSAALAQLIVFDGAIRADGKSVGIQNLDIPNGIAGYLPNCETQRICRKYLGKGYIRKDGIVFIERHFCYVEALFTMGSIGSIAHTTGSDIDYWVCIREELFDNEKRELLQKKLHAIEKWAKNVFKTDIHFFIVDIDKAKRSDFGGSDSESSGSAQGRLLKEEFYRTMIHVAGQLPFWATLPVDVSKNYYNELFVRVCPNPAKGRFIDFGDIHDIPAGEYFGASVWQMFKYLKSPFKSVLKMGLLEKYIHEKKRDRVLLCNDFKKEWMNPGLSFNLTKSDPYYLLLSSLVAYYKKIDPEHLFAKFVQSCFFSKVSITDEKELKKSAFGLKEILIKRCMDEWGWKDTEVFEAGKFETWTYNKIAEESVKIRRYMLQTYKQCRRIWTSSDASYEKESLLTPRDRTILGRKMVVQFSMDEKAKVEPLLLVSKSGLTKGLNLQYNDDVKDTQKWLLMHKWRDDQNRMENNEKLKAAACIEELGAWLIHNELYLKENYIKIVHNPTVVRSNDVNLLFQFIYDFFIDDIKKEITNDALCSKSTITSMLISINFTVPRDSKLMTEWSVIYRNSWGEMFCHLFTSNPGLRDVKDVENRVQRELQLSSFPLKTKILSYPKLKQELKGVS